MAAGGHCDVLCGGDEKEECHFCCENYQMSGYYPYCSEMCEQEAAEARDRQFWAEIDEHDALQSHAEYLMEEMARVNAEREQEEADALHCALTRSSGAEEAAVKELAPCRLTRSSGAEELAPLPCVLTRSANTGPPDSSAAECTLAPSSANNTHYTDDPVFWNWYERVAAGYQKFLVHCRGCEEPMALPIGASDTRPFCSAECALPYLCGYQEEEEKEEKKADEKQYGLPPLLPLCAAGLPPLLAK